MWYAWSCDQTNNFWPLIALLPYSMLPIPQLLCAQVDSAVVAVEENGWKVMGDFLTGILAVSIFAIPAVMAHVDAVRARH